MSFPTGASSHSVFTSRGKAGCYLISEHAIFDDLRSISRRSWLDRDANTLAFPPFAQHHSNTLKRQSNNLGGSCLPFSLGLCPWHKRVSAFL